MVHDHQIEYCEITVPMQHELANLICQFMYEVGPMRLCGYLPGWQHDPISGKYHDLAIFSFEHKSTTLDYRPPKLIAAARQLQSILHLEDLISMIPALSGVQSEDIPITTTVD